MSADELLEAAKALPKKGRHNTDMILVYVETARGKGYTYREIHEQLIKLGVHVHPVASTFTSGMSQRFKRARIKALAGRDAK